MDFIASNRKRNTLALALAAIVAVAGPAVAREKKGVCPMPDGVKCMSLADVYAHTNNADKLGPSAQPAVEIKDPAPAAQMYVGAPKPTGRVAYRPVKHADAAPSGNTLAIITPTASTASVMVQTVTTYTPPSAEPVRAPAKVMRILVTAWEDDGGSLHMPGTIFTEIEPRRWRVTPGAGRVPVSTMTATSHDDVLEGLGNRAAKDSQAAAVSAVAVSNRPGS